MAEARLQRWHVWNSGKFLSPGSPDTKKNDQGRWVAAADAELMETENAALKCELDARGDADIKFAEDWRGLENMMTELRALFTTSVAINEARVAELLATQAELVGAAGSAIYIMEGVAMGLQITAGQEDDRQALSLQKRAGKLKAAIVRAEGS